MKVLILFGHPAYHNSTVNRGLLRGIDTIDNVTFHNLYEEYPEMDIDIDREQALLVQHDCIIFMYPFFWYSTPAIFREWQDLVLEHGWAFGSKGKALKGKWFLTALSTGGSRKMYQVGKMQNFTLREFLHPLFQMATVCNMIPLPPFVTHGTNNMDDAKLNKSCLDFHYLLKIITEDKLELKEVLKHEYINDIIKMEV